MAVAQPQPAHRVCAEQLERSGAAALVERREEGGLGGLALRAGEGDEGVGAGVGVSLRDHRCGRRGCVLVDHSCTESPP